MTFPLPPQMSKVKQRDWRLFRAKLINQFASENGDSKLEWGDGNWAHELVHVEPVSTGSILV